MASWTTRPYAARACRERTVAAPIGWTGPCPPKGPAHHYVFSLYALSSPSGLSDGVDGPTAIATLQNTHNAPATLTGTYQRGG